VDPERMSVLFERFMSVERKEPPDIDIDFEHQRREEVDAVHLQTSTGAIAPRSRRGHVSYRTKSAQCATWARRWASRWTRPSSWPRPPSAQMKKWISEACLAENEIDRTRPNARFEVDHARRHDPRLSHAT
jgi:error-prone DNA polymerase